MYQVPVHHGGDWISSLEIFSFILIENLTMYCFIYSLVAVVIVAPLFQS